MSYVFVLSFVLYRFFFFNDTATTEIYTLSLHDALPICTVPCRAARAPAHARRRRPRARSTRERDRKSTRLNSSHLGISYAVFCLKKKKTEETQPHHVTPAQENAESPEIHEGTHRALQ